jgi:hypothetical protein
LYLEIAVIVLTGIEIILSIGGIWLGFREGRQQAKVLSNIADSTRDSVDAMKELRKEQAESLTAMNNMFGEAVAPMKSQLATLRANIRETPVVPLINEQGEKEKGRDEWHFSWCSSLGGFGWRGTERRRAKRAAA